MKKLRKLIRNLILESSHQHRCLSGDMVDPESLKCFDDICLRIDDAIYTRDSYNRGTANRAYYNGVLSNLRNKKRKLAKLHINPTE